MLLSIVIPAYNEEKYLGKTLQTLVNQKHECFDVEIIVVNSESTDTTAQIATRYGVTVLTVPRHTPASARQAGIEKAKGEIVACCDADTVVSDDWFTKICDHFQKDPQLVGLTGTVVALDGPLYIRLFIKYVWGLFYFINFHLGKTIFQGQNFAFKKEASIKIGGLNIRLYSAEDADFGNRLSKVGKVQFFNDVLVYTSTRRVGKEKLFKVLTRWPFAYLKVVWGINTGNYEVEPFPAVR